MAVTTPTAPAVIWPKPLKTLENIVDSLPHHSTVRLRLLVKVILDGATTLYSQNHPTPMEAQGD